MPSVGDILSSVLTGTQSSNEILAESTRRFQEGNAQANAESDKSFAMQEEAVTQKLVNDQGRANVSFIRSKKSEELQVQFDAESKLAGNLALLQTSREAYAPARAEYDRAMSKDLLTDPLGYIFAQLQLPALAAKVNSIADAESLAQQRIQSDAGSLDSARKTILANTADQLLQLDSRDAEIQNQLARAALMQAKSQTSVRQAATELQVAQMADKINDNNRSTAGIAIQVMEAQANRAERAANANDRERRWKVEQADREQVALLRREQWEIALKDKQRKETAELLMNTQLQKLGTSLGMPQPPTIDVLMTMSQKERDKWITNAQNNSFGQNINEALSFFAEVGGPNTQNIKKGSGTSYIDTAGRLSTGFAEYQKKAKQEFTAQGKTPTLQQLNERASQLYEAEMKGAADGRGGAKDMTDSFWDRTPNVYTAPFYAFNSAVLSREDSQLYRDLQGNEFFKLVETYRTTPQGQKNPNLSTQDLRTIIDSGIELVKAGKITAREFAGQTADYMKKVNDYNWQMSGYQLFSLPANHNYVVSIEGSMYPRDNRIQTDLMDAALLENAITQKARVRSIGNALEEGSLFIRKLYPVTAPAAMQESELRDKMNKGK